MTLTAKQLKKAARIILVGAPGVGKGTQTERLLANFPELASISSGDLLRENVRNKTSLGMTIFSIPYRATANFSWQAWKQKPQYKQATSSPTL